MSLSGKVAVVTGGSRGIGHAVARALLARGARVVISGTNESGLAEAAGELRALARPGEQVLHAVADVREYAAVERLMQTAAEGLGGLDILINNAGVGIFEPVADMPLDNWHAVIDTNLTGVFHCCRAALPHLRRRGGGWIINISSLAGKNPFAEGAAYCASKSGLNAFSEALMQELRRDHIRVTYILPGSVATEFSGRESSLGADWKLLPEDVAQAIVEVLNHPPRSLPSRVEIRPSRPQKS